MPNETFQLIVMGASAGGYSALLTILAALPKHFPVPIVIVLHIAPTSDGVLPSLLDIKCQIHVKEAEDKEFIKPSTAYVAPPGYHLLVCSKNDLALSVDEKVNFSRPSIDVLFESAADIYGEKLIGILLTGANSDGARGLKKIKENSGLTIIQDPSTAENPAMPNAALQHTTVDHVMTLENIADFLNKTFA